MEMMALSSFSVRNQRPASAVHQGHPQQRYRAGWAGLNIIFNIKKQIWYLSQGTTLEAGTLFLTGTPAGIGYFPGTRVVLKDGDEISVKIDQIGTLVNKVRYESR
ncbi:Fumarylacetoacetase C-terminal-like protein [Penicillium maclennaniae]|uniref:Fumarylacetoacetase C-terminal-like protein n=1 Tax=Penicillium maclennaniae TaxID=1343394 RepID=UPI0025421E1D|nr:Fumarylacetoacetase C-terminal-like protein [Penicillium maclennaniae]KAJ5683656.1 Fumarylacetoacetase C-terminal-like protein [Penicillium maclennaniae]